MERPPATTIARRIEAAGQRVVAALHELDERLADLAAVEGTLVEPLAGPPGLVSAPAADTVSAAPASQPHSMSLAPPVRRSAWTHVVPAALLAVAAMLVLAALRRRR